MQKSKLVPSRQLWKQKALQRRQENKDLGNCLAAARQSRDRWKQKYLQVEQELVAFKESMGSSPPPLQVKKK